MLESGLTKALSPSPAILYCLKAGHKNVVPILEWKKQKIVCFHLQAKYQQSIKLEVIQMSKREAASGPNIVARSIISASVGSGGYIFFFLFLPTV